MIPPFYTAAGQDSDQRLEMQQAGLPAAGVRQPMLTDNAVPSKPHSISCRQEKNSFYPAVILLRLLC